MAGLSILTVTRLASAASVSPAKKGPGVRRLAPHFRHVDDPAVANPRAILRAAQPPNKLPLGIEAENPSSPASPK